MTKSRELESKSAKERENSTVSWMVGIFIFSSILVLIAPVLISFGGLTAKLRLLFSVLVFLFGLLTIAFFSETNDD